MEADSFLAKAEESLASAEDDYAKGRYNACARNTYYALFQAAVAALQAENILPRGDWTHEFVQGQFSGLLIYRRKIYPSLYSSLLAEAFRVRTRADYTAMAVPPRAVTRTLQHARSLISLVKEKVHGSRQT